ncbi:MAG: peroxiredoxin [Gammaproteobacteria bacterium]|jgi:thioredoxin-dependent peroxiredoxin|nr:peroxiredoxin [Gammaproteobacteria bacterium]MBT4462443.1 peroxiredoxin [Gammaproteobacteria bacterium]MBT4655045.1 peroxiredoxin [Gammaproteobacteria bacterium]MBT5116686.1 peroxiredoxin [Gammaproteobacteria bacterium]MBT5762185.1 peroxiredoxin [Gammaproteobacteria bacterium]
MKIEIGSKIKDISIITTDNKNKLSDYLAKNLIIYFYPKDMTPGCTTESIEFNDNLLKIKRVGWNVVGVSRDNLKKHSKFIDKYSFKFPLIADEDENLCNMFDVIKEKSLYGRKYMGIDRSTFLISKNLKVLHIWRNVKVNGHVEEVVKKIKELK